MYAHLGKMKMNPDGKLKKQGTQMKILFIFEVFANVKRFSFYIKSSSGYVMHLLNYI